MAMRLVGYQLKTVDPQSRLVALRRLRAHRGRLLLLDTCQRLELYGGPDLDALEAEPVAERWEDAAAFERIARIAAGLESRILGELEVLGQVRHAYKQYRNARPQGCSLDRFFQDALALARRARRESGIDRNLISLAALAARELMACVPSSANVAVVGAGSIAASVARYLNKRGRYPVRVASRCPQRAAELALTAGGFGVGLDELAPLLSGVSGIITATAAPHPVLYEHHLRDAARPIHIIDLGEPPDCDEHVLALADVHYTGLRTIEEKAQINTAERVASAEQAALIIKHGAREWVRRRPCTPLRRPHSPGKQHGGRS